MLGPDLLRAGTLTGLSEPYRVRAFGLVAATEQTYPLCLRQVGKGHKNPLAHSVPQNFIFTEVSNRFFNAMEVFFPLIPNLHVGKGLEAKT